MSQYPLFYNPERYLLQREKQGLYRRLKRYFEWRALRRCFSLMPGIKSVCDLPCGPGRLFQFWHKHSLSVVGLDMSDNMLEAAKQLHSELSLDGGVSKADAFNLPEDLPGCDLLVSVRFIYYFDPEQRIELLRKFAKLSNHYVIVQYKTYETRKGRRNAAKTPRALGAYRKKFCSYPEIEKEVKIAGFKLIKIVPIAQSSDRVFVALQIPSTPTTLY